MVAAHGLGTLLSRLDLQVENGDIAVTKDGDLRLGDVAQNALVRLVQRWRFTEPQIRALHALLDEATAVKGRMGNARDRFPIRWDEAEVSAWRDAGEREGAAEVGTNTFAGCIVLLVSGMLLRFKDDLDATADEWRTAGTMLGGHSVGELVVAAANGFRHDDEWRKTRPPTPQQARSQTVIEAALGPRASPLGYYPGRCAEVVSALAGGDGLEGLARAVLGFGRAIVQKRQALAGGGPNGSASTRRAPCARQWAS